MPVKSVDILYRFGEGANASYMSATEGEVLQLKQGQLANIICRVKVDGSDLDPVVDVTVSATAGDYRVYTEHNVTAGR